jgi:fido (protein-threonine AMPylation protein)
VTHHAVVGALQGSRGGRWLSSRTFGHPFREGNGTTTRVLLEHLAEHTPFVLDFARMSSGGVEPGQRGVDA